MQYRRRQDRGAEGAGPRRRARPRQARRIRRALQGTRRLRLRPRPRPARTGTRSCRSGNYADPAAGADLPARRARAGAPPDPHRPSNPDIAMKIFPLSSDRVSLGVTETGGHLSDVAFDIGGGRPRDADARRALGPGRPAGPTSTRSSMCSAAISSAPRSAPTTSCRRRNASTAHRPTAHGGLRPRATAGSTPCSTSDVMGARVTKRVEVRPGETMVYQRHTLDGRQRAPAARPARHAPCRSAAPARLFAFRLGGNAAGAGRDAAGRAQRPRLPGRTITDLTRAGLADGGTADLTRFPFADGHDDIWGLASDPDAALRLDGGDMRRSAAGSGSR